MNPDNMRDSIVIGDGVEIEIVDDGVGELHLIDCYSGQERFTCTLPELEQAVGQLRAFQNARNAMKGTQP